MCMHACVLSHFSHVRLFVTPGTVATRLLCPLSFPGKNTGVGCRFLLQGIFLTQRLNSPLLRQADSLPQSHLGIPTYILLVAKGRGKKEAIHKPKKKSARSFRQWFVLGGKTKGWSLGSVCGWQAENEGKPSWKG